MIRYGEPGGREHLSIVAHNAGWKLHEHGADTSCREGGVVPIWLKPCAWDERVMTPVGCHCCVDLDAVLRVYMKECHDWKHRGERPPKHSEKPGALAPPPDWIKPYNPR